MHEQQNFHLPSKSEVDVGVGEELGKVPVLYLFNKYYLECYTGSAILLIFHKSLQQKFLPVY